MSNLLLIPSSIFCIINIVVLHLLKFSFGHLYLPCLHFTFWTYRITVKTVLMPFCANSAFVSFGLVSLHWWLFSQWVMFFCLCMPGNPTGARYFDFYLFVCWLFLISSSSSWALFWDIGNIWILLGLAFMIC